MDWPMSSSHNVMCYYEVTDTWERVLTWRKWIFKSFFLFLTILSPCLSLLPGYQDLSCSPVPWASITWFLFALGPIATGLKDYGLIPVKPRARPYAPLSRLSWDFITVRESWLACWLTEWWAGGQWDRKTSLATCQLSSKPETRPRYFPGDRAWDTEQI